MNLTLLKFFNKKSKIFLYMVFLFGIFLGIVLAARTSVFEVLDSIYPQYETTSETYLYRPISESAKIPLAITNTPLLNIGYQPFWWANSTGNIPYMPDLDNPIFLGSSSPQNYFGTPKNLFDYITKSIGDDVDLFHGGSQLPETMPPATENP